MPKIASTSTEVPVHTLAGEVSRPTSGTRLTGLAIAGTQDVNQQVYLGLSTADACH